MLDDDLYKFTMRQAIDVVAPRVNARTSFINRGGTKFPRSFAEELRREIADWPELRLTDAEADWMDEQRFFNPWFIESMMSYRYKPKEVDIQWHDGDIKIDFEGRWSSVTMWEVKMMYTVCELYFRNVDRDWTRDGEMERAKSKVLNLSGKDFTFADFGTRRRRDFTAQENFVRTAVGSPGFSGTSNCHLAMLNGCKAIGTKAHEFIQGMSAIHGLIRSNHHAMAAWQQVYQGDLGIALPDTYGMKAFYRDFNRFFAKLYDGIRHDSGDPFKFADEAVAHYKSLGIDPTTKSLIFSDDLTDEKGLLLAAYVRDRIKCAICIGTFFSNDFLRTDGTKSSPLKIVIKLLSINGIDVVKLGEGEGKAVGSPDAIAAARFTMQGVPIGCVA